MNEKLQYASMLEIPVNTCTITYKEGKSRKKRRKHKEMEDAKELLINKINAREEVEENKPALAENQADDIEQNLGEQQALEGIEQEIIEENNTSTVSVKSASGKKTSKLSIIGVQIAVIGALVATIFLTNAFYADSGINVFLRSVFGGVNTVEQIDERTYVDFKPVLALGDSSSMTLDDGVITLSGKGSVYSPCDGKISDVIRGEDGKFTVTVWHCEKFSTVLSGLDYAYVEKGGAVYGNIPVGYMKEGGATLCFSGENGAVISDYQIIDGSVVWSV